MKHRFSWLAFLISGFCLVSIPVLAHHGLAAYDSRTII